MKKVLFATTALIATAGMASAQGVTLSGSAEMGVFGGDRFVGVGSSSDLQFHTDIDVSFTMSGVTDNGLTFGASIDLDESTADPNPAFADDSDDGGATIFVSGSLGTLTLGDTDGALDWALREAAIGGSIADDHTFHAGYNGNSGLDGTFDGQIARYDYTFGDFSVGASLEIDDAGLNTSDPVIGIGAKYSGDFGGFSVGLGFGYQTVEIAGVDRDVYGFSADTNIAGFDVIFNYSDLDGAGGNDDHYAIAVGYTMDALTVGFNYGEFDKVVGPDSDGYGLAVDYDLGGGAELQFGYGDSDNGTIAGDVDSYSFGLSLTF